MDIAEDVKKAAREAFADTKVISASLVAEDEDSDVLPYIISRAARAIQAERERCAKVCEAVGSDLDPQYADHIASAIRSGETGR